jgi:transposase
VLSHVSLALNGTFNIHQSVVALSSTKAFTHGTVIVTSRDITFSKLPALPLPDGFVPTYGTTQRADVDGKHAKQNRTITLHLQLVGPDGEPKKQTRTIVLVENDKTPGVFKQAGQSKTPSTFSADDGWKIANYNFRAYFTHPGVKTDDGIPAWLRASTERQTKYWNKLAWLCREARRACSDVSVEDIKAFVSGTILPAIDALNNTLGNPKLKMKHPTKLKTDTPTLDAVWRFVGVLKGRVEKDLPVPPNLLEQVSAYTDLHKADYAPLNDFTNNLNTVLKTEAKALNLKTWEQKPIERAFLSVIKRRRTTKCAFTEGWPLIKYPDRRNFKDWSIQFNFNKAGIPASNIDTARGFPSISFGAPLSPKDTGHLDMTGKGTKSASKRKLRQAHISIAGDNHERWEFTFAVLQHRELPAGSHVKGWKLVYSEGQLFLGLVVELQRAIPEKTERAAGLDIGWRKIGDSIRFGMLYEPNGQTFRDLRVELLKSPGEPRERLPFHLDLGPDQWTRRNMKLLVPDWNPGDPTPTMIDIKSSLASRRANIQREAIRKLQEYYGEKPPVWLGKVGRRGLLKKLVDLANNAQKQVPEGDRTSRVYEDDPGAVAIIAAWKKEDEEFDASMHQRSLDFMNVSEYLRHMTKRIEYGHYQIAHDVCRHLQSSGISLLNIEEKFLSKVAQNQSNLDSEGLKKSQKYRQLVAAGAFVMILRNIADKYGIVVQEVPCVNTSRTCHFCYKQNLGTDQLRFTCAFCGKTVDQDQNAAIILSGDLTESAVAA